MKPDDIPEDVWEAATKADAECQRNSCKEHACNGFLCANAVRVAILAERERCLRIIAEQKRLFMSPEYAYPQPIGSLSERFACDQIAAAIRQPREGNGG